MIDLREKDQQAIGTLASQIFTSGTEIWAYGSRVKGTNHDTSDLDLVVHFPSGQSQVEDLQQLSDFIEALQDSNIPIIVQVFAWHSMPEVFQKNIQENYQVFWKASAQK